MVHVQNRCFSLISTCFCLLFFSMLLLDVILFVIWLVFISNHNRFKSFPLSWQVSHQILNSASKFNPNDVLFLTNPIWLFCLNGKDGKNENPRKHIPLPYRHRHNAFSKLMNGFIFILPFRKDVNSFISPRFDVMTYIVPHWNSVACQMHCVRSFPRRLWIDLNAKKTLNIQHRWMVKTNYRWNYAIHSTEHDTSFSFSPFSLSHPTICQHNRHHSTDNTTKPNPLIRKSGLIQVAKL